MKKTRKNRPRNLQYESLERREVMTAGVTAGLSGGVLNAPPTGDTAHSSPAAYAPTNSAPVLVPLTGSAVNSAPVGANLTGSIQTTFVNGVVTINGTNGNDTIKLLHAWNGYLAIQGRNDAWQASSVTSIVINLQDGSDLVSLDSMANGGSFAIGSQVTINSGAGSNQCILLGGQTVDFNGSGHQFKLNTNGTATLDGQAVNTVNVPSTVQTSFVNGVVTITCTNNNDTLRFLKAWNGYITIQGRTDAWLAAQVTSIVIHLNGGDDIISLDSLANSGSFALGVPVTINSGIGNKRVFFENGNHVDFAGAGHQLKVVANGSASCDGWHLDFSDPAPDPDPTPDPDPPVTNWFDSHVIDSAMRTLGHDLYLDGVINRSDIIAILQSAEDGGSVDSTELTDLQAIAGNTSLFGSLDYVRKLTSYVIAGSAANANYQGQALGNLTVGTTTTKLENLIGKWFLGLDHPTAAGTYRQVAGQLFVNGATYTDIKQGSVGDCYFVSSLAESALRNPSAVSNMFVVNGDGTYTVRFYNAGQAEYVTVDSYLPTNSGGGLIYANMGSAYNNSSNELWVTLAEKAYVQANQFGWIRPGLTGNGQNAYTAIEGGYIYAALGHVTGQSTTPFAWTTSAGSFNTFVNAWNAGKGIGFATVQTPPDATIVGNHAYAAIGYDSVNQTVTLYNPWGAVYSGKAVTVTLTWAQIQQNFSYFDRTA